MNNVLLPQEFDMNSPMNTYVVRYQQAPMSFEARHIATSSNENFNEELKRWLTDIRAITQGAELSAPIVLDFSPATTLSRIAERTGWSRREFAKIIGRSHTEVGRILDGSRASPDDAVVRVIADLDFATDNVARAVGNDRATLRRIFFVAPLGESIAAIHAIRTGHVYQAMRMARRVLYPRVEGMLQIPDSDIGDRTNAYLDED